MFLKRKDSHYFWEGPQNFVRAFFERSLCKINTKQDLKGFCEIDVYSKDYIRVSCKNLQGLFLNFAQKILNL